MRPEQPAGLRVQFADGSERVPDAVLYAGRTGWIWNRLAQWEVYVVGTAQPVGFSADRIPAKTAITFRIRYLAPEA